MQNFLTIIKKIIRTILFCAGIVCIILAIGANTRVPFDMHRWLGLTGAAFKYSPTTIVMLGGSGMPSESNLIRLFYCKELALLYPQSRILIVHPNDTHVVNRMVSFLESFGIAGSRIVTNPKGTNTREQALQLMKSYPEIAAEKIVLVTSPEHMYRSLKTFRKIGFKTVGGIAAFENPMFISLAYDHGKVGGGTYVPDVSENLGLRYNFWNYLKLEITCLREYAAIAYYKVNGWM